jgi:ABC-type Na+ efflux pump permease subunit
VNRAAWLIAEREFRTYTATWTFWLALFIGPLLMAGAILLAAAPKGETRFQVVATDPALAARAQAAVAAALTVEGQPSPQANADGPALRIAPGPDGAAVLSFDRDFPLTQTGRALVAERLESGRDPADAPQYRVAPAPPRDLAKASRFSVMMMLWLSLVGSLGMLLQAVVRERSNRALETLLASAGPTAVVGGTVVGVGLVSLLVLGAWLGSAGAAALVAPGTAEMLPALLRQLGEPLLLARALLIYVLAYGFYGLVTVAIGALARDSAAAQNLARPMFITLMGAYFFALAAAGGGFSATRWLIFFPPLTPFLLLLKPASPAMELIALMLLGVSAAVAGWAARFLLARVFDPTPVRRARS